jgi:glycerol-1-phosphate dehydrogenase [NAD(P)+]
MDLYHRPASEFVAGFIGAPSMNFRRPRGDPRRAPGDGRLGLRRPRRQGARGRRLAPRRRARARAARRVAWPLVQDNLRGWLADPAAIAAGDAGALAGLFVGLTAVGLAMEFHGSSRPASGADHQIAHLWEMADLHHDGERVAHGACVAVGCVDGLRLYDWLIARDLAVLDAERIVARAPARREGRKRSPPPSPTPPSPPAHARRPAPSTSRPRPTAPASTPCAPPGRTLRATLEGHLMRAEAMRALLAAAGAPTGAGDIGVAPNAHRAAIAASRFIRSRYTVLDLLDECGLHRRGPRRRLRDARLPRSMTGARPWT